MTGDWIYYDPIEGTADKYGYYTSDIDGVMTLWHVQLSTGIARSFDVVTANTQILINLTSLIKNATKPYIDGHYPLGNR